jgi:hypothetical protein
MPRREGDRDGGTGGDWQREDRTNRGDYMTVVMHTPAMIVIEMGREVEIGGIV